MTGPRNSGCMQCDLCEYQGPGVIRVNGWTVCNTCSHNDVLKNALDAKAKLEKLKEQLSAADLDAHGASAFKREAETRVNAALRELETAIDALVPIVARAARADDVVAKARLRLEQFAESPEGAKLPRT